MEDNSLSALRQEWRHTIHGKGGSCPVCERFGKVYKRHLNKTMARSLLWLYNESLVHGPRAWIDVPNTAGKEIVRSNQLPSLRWWGLVERQADATDDGKTKHSGMWRITLRGMDFVEGRCLVAKTVLTYNAECVGQGAALVNFKTCLDTPFDHDALYDETNEEHADKLFAPAA